ncbi:MAG: hypothetical protein PHE59_05100 [Patescibacteria group bacterium]|nr:hypothetical protein [Patescibacteria group bacterium]
MIVMVNCGKCTDLHRYDDVEDVIIFRRQEGGLSGRAFAAGEYLAIVPDESAEAGFSLFNSPGWTSENLLVVSRGLRDIADSMAGKKRRKRTSAKPAPAMGQLPGIL